MLYAEYSTGKLQSTKDSKIADLKKRLIVFVPVTTCMITYNKMFYAEYPFDKLPSTEDSRTIDLKKCLTCFVPQQLLHGCQHMYKCFVPNMLTDCCLLKTVKSLT